MVGLSLRSRSRKGSAAVMKVDGNRPVDVARTTGRARAGSASSPGFSPIFPEDTKPAAQAASAPPLAGVDALLALQGVGSSTSERGKAVRRGRDMLDLLDEIRAGMLDGAVSEGTLRRLVVLVDAKREDFVDPGLSQVMDEIDLRARVELAKLGFSAGR